jgi:hypothetical protein
MNSLKTAAKVEQNIRVVTRIVVTETRNAAMVAESAAGLLYDIGMVAQGVAKTA